ncbi:hypothetical protein [Marinigracilibium pacificum]|uniref:DUF4252 domain-containing protein n=1 Tax=Marinigracilibium pacificum TaxID=2729599 RepID=A0A848IYM1_9BACT|nr:hypothetical protein [Marinigracilibium pacificum]NMM49377.1 hypothetical protein [Marinigracilibium pacificum]
MNKNIFNIALAFAFLTLVVSCGKKDSGEVAEQINYDSVYSLYNTVKFKSDSSWEHMIYEDNGKLELMEELISIMAQSGLSSEEAEKLKNGLNDLKSLQYSRADLKESEKIDIYDSATDSYTMQLFEAADKIKVQDINGEAEIIMDSIESANNNRLMLRIDHDAHTKVYNEIIMNFPDSISSLENGVKPEERGIFTLPFE